MVGACDKNGYFYAFRTSDVAAGPVWKRKLGVGQGFNGNKACLSAAVWDGTRLIVGSPPTTITGVSYGGSVRALDPATGAVLWQTGLPNTVLGSPSENASGIVAAATYNPTSGAVNGTYLLDASTGTILKTIPNDAEFGQPVFADNYLLLATHTQGLQVYSP
jgi:outer membrane protein assembly factor BamB